MIPQMKIAYRFLIVMGFGGLLLLLTLYVPIISSQEDFSIYNTGWNGCSDLGKDVYSTGSFLPTIDISESSQDMVVHNSLDEYGDEIEYGRSSILVLGPVTEFTNSEGRFVHDFLNEGGILLLADDIGSGNDLLEKLNTSTRISGGIMMDLSFMKKGEFSVTTDLTPHRITRNVSMVLMNYPSTVRTSRNGVSIMNSSGSSWLDSNRNHVKDPDEDRGPFHILTIEPYGKGWLIVLSEPSIMINQMRGSEGMDNDVLVDNLISFVSSGRDTLIVDESHRDLTNPVQVAGKVISSFDPTHKIAILVVMTLFFIVIETPIPKITGERIKNIIDRLMKEEVNEPPSNAEVLEKLKSEHPGWNHKVLDRLFDDIGGE